VFDGGVGVVHNINLKFQVSPINHRSSPILYLVSSRQLPSFRSRDCKFRLQVVVATRSLHQLFVDVHSQSHSNRARDVR
jgi:hypothetical protein